MKVLSLFDGISCGMLALERAGILVERYVAYEINNDAIKVSQTHYPQIEQCGDVTKADFTQYEGFDLLIGGSPCQDFSTLNNKRLGLNGKKSGLFWEYVRALNECKPQYFLLENNDTMSKESRNIISNILGVKPTLINSNLASAQNRKRLYWTNIPNVTTPKDKNINLQDVLLLPWGFFNTHTQIELVPFVQNKIPMIIEKYGYLPEMFNPYNKSEIITKSPCLTAEGESQTKSSSIIVHDGGRYYMLNSVDWEILQTLPQGYTSCLIKENKRKTVIGNAWTVDIISHIFSYLTNQND